ncbi:CidA/LrgA family protein [Marmoricola sp. RAF53]|uniref:CidA/LrgA family protein n=1 Tax=Marmoricola sp. RAF53 TaxID=3233059 RepID=UPI003F9671D3
MLRGIVALLGLQVVGEVAVRLTGVDIPGPVVGMALFFLVLQRLRPAENASVVQAPAFLLRHLQLLFVPVGVGIVVYLDTLRDQALPLAAGLWVSWLVGFTVTALVVALLLRLTHRSGR